jgi:hypothetical protein
MTATDNFCVALHNLVHMDSSYLDSGKNTLELGRVLAGSRIPLWSGPHAKEFWMLSLAVYTALKEHHEQIGILYSVLKRGRIDVSDAEESVSKAKRELAIFQIPGPMTAEGLVQLETRQTSLNDALENLRTQVTDAVNALSYCNVEIDNLKILSTKVDQQLRELGSVHDGIALDKEAPSADVLGIILERDYVRFWARSVYQNSRWASVPLNPNKFYDWVNSIDKIQKGNFKNLQIVNGLVFSKLSANGVWQLDIGRWLKAVGKFDKVQLVTEFFTDKSLINEYLEDFHREWSLVLGADLYDTFFRELVEIARVAYLAATVATNLVQFRAQIFIGLKALAACAKFLGSAVATAPLVVAGVCVTVGTLSAFLADELILKEIESLGKESLLGYLLQSAFEIGYHNMATLAGSSGGS